MRGGFERGAGSSGIERVGGEKDAGRESEDAPGGEKGARDGARILGARGPGAHPSARRPTPMSDIAGEPAVPCVRPRAPRPRGRDPTVWRRARPTGARPRRARRRSTLLSLSSPPVVRSRHHVSARSSRGLLVRFGWRVRSTGTQFVQSPFFSRIAAADLGIPDRADDGSRARFSFSPDRSKRRGRAMNFIGTTAPPLGRFGRSNVSLPLLSSPQKKKIATTTTAIDYETQTGLSWHSCKQANPVNPEI